MQVSLWVRQILSDACEYLVSETSRPTLYLDIDLTLSKVKARLFKHQVFGQPSRFTGEALIDLGVYGLALDEVDLSVVTSANVAMLRFKNCTSIGSIINCPRTEVPLDIVCNLSAPTANTYETLPPQTSRLTIDRTHASDSMPPFFLDGIDLIPSLESKPLIVVYQGELPPFNILSLVRLLRRAPQISFKLIAIRSRLTWYGVVDAADDVAKTISRYDEFLLAGNSAAIFLSDSFDVALRAPRVTNWRKFLLSIQSRLRSLNLEYII
jgi:hypothetical protein